MTALKACKQIKAILAPTMRQQPPDSVAVMLSAMTLRRIYELAKEGTK